MLQGSIVALVTPFTHDLEVDYGKLAELIEWHVAEGTDGIVLCGTTGESPTLSEEEHAKIFRTAVGVAKGKIPLIAGTGTNDTRKTVERTEAAKGLGVDGCLVIVPYYSRPTPEGCLAHYKEVANVGLPTIVYHHPGRTGVRLSPEILQEICKIPHIVAIKESSGTLDIARHLDGITFFSGDDPLTLPMMELGAKGVISVVANLIPGKWKEMTQAFLQGDSAKAQEISTRYASLCEAMMLETNPQCVKYALSLMGKCLSTFRLPLIEPRASTKAQIQMALSLSVKVTTL